jgi:hypothetical protein
MENPAEKTTEHQTTPIISEIWRLKASRFCNPSTILAANTPGFRATDEIPLNGNAKARMC